MGSVSFVAVAESDFHGPALDRPRSLVPQEPFDDLLGTYNLAAGKTRNYGLGGAVRVDLDVVDLQFTGLFARRKEQLVITNDRSDPVLSPDEKSSAVQTTYFQGELGAYPRFIPEVPPVLYLGGIGYGGTERSCSSDGNTGSCDTGGGEMRTSEISSFIFGADDGLNLESPRTVGGAGFIIGLDPGGLIPRDVKLVGGLQLYFKWLSQFHHRDNIEAGRNGGTHVVFDENSGNPIPVNMVLRGDKAPKYFAIGIRGYLGGQLTDW